MNDRAFPIVSVRDIPSAQAFYERLGLVKTYQFPPEGEPGFVTLERGVFSIGLGAGGAAAEDRFSYWVYVDDVDATVSELRAAGTPVDGEPTDEPWGERFAHVRDPDGNVVHLGAPI